MKVEKHIAADVEPGVPVRASQTGLMAFILTYIRARGRKRPQAEVEEVREAEEVTEVKEIKEVEERRLAAEAWHAVRFGNSVVPEAWWLAAANSRGVL